MRDRLGQTSGVAMVDRPYRNTASNVCVPPGHSTLALNSAARQAHTSLLVDRPIRPDILCITQKIQVH